MSAAPDNYKVKLSWLSNEEITVTTFNNGAELEAKF